MSCKKCTHIADDICDNSSAIVDRQKLTPVKPGNWGDANYSKLDQANGNWLAVIQWNGELTLAMQQHLEKVIINAINGAKS